MSDAPPAGPDGWRWLGRGLRVALVVIGLSPFVPLVTRSVPLLTPVAELFEAWFRFQCHRDPGRSLHFLEQALPVCVRCFGIYAGLGLGGLFARPRLDAGTLRVWVSLAAAAMILDVFAEARGWHPPWPIFRLATGLLLALPVGASLANLGAPANAAPR